MGRRRPYDYLYALGMYVCGAWPSSIAGGAPYNQSRNTFESHAGVRKEVPKCQRTMISETLHLPQPLPPLDTMKNSLKFSTSSKGFSKDENFTISGGSFQARKPSQSIENGQESYNK